MQRDGKSCGIFIQLSAVTVIENSSVAREREIIDLFSVINLISAPALCYEHGLALKNMIFVVVDGSVVDYVRDYDLEELTNQHRLAKVQETVDLSSMTSKIVTLFSTKENPALCLGCTSTLEKLGS